MSITTALAARAKRAAYHLPAPWRQALRKRYTAYSIRSDPPPAELPVLTRLITPGSVVIDAGANVGAYTVALARAVPSAHVLSVEPVPTTHELLVHVVETNRLANVTVLAAALSDRVGIVVMEIPETEGQPVLALARIKYSDAGQPPLHTHVSVMTTTIDAVMAEDLRTVSLIKCDVEMHELELLRGARATIRRHAPAIYAELQPDFATKASQRGEISALLAAEGYAPFYWNGSGLSPGMDALDVLYLTAAHRRQLGMR
jgi:FkbM family methyltransferase